MRRTEPLAFGGAIQLKMFQAMNPETSYQLQQNAGQSLAKLEFLSKRLIAADILMMQVIQQTATLADHHDQSAS
jgi:hypothetical protein